MSVAQDAIFLYALLVAVAVNAVLNAVVPRPRPFLALPARVLVPPPHDSSFPSDHASVPGAHFNLSWIS